MVKGLLDEHMQNIAVLVLKKQRDKVPEKL